MSEATEIQMQKLIIYLYKFANSVLDNPSLKNNDEIFKTFFGEDIEFQKYLISYVVKDAACLYKNFDEQLDENQREIKNNLGEIIEQGNLFFKKLDERAY